MGGTGPPFDLCVHPDQIDKAIALADLAPDVQFGFDRCGAPDVRARAERRWRVQANEQPGLTKWSTSPLSSRSIPSIDPNAREDNS